MAAARMLEFCYEIKSSSRWDRTGTRDGFVEAAGRRPGREERVWSLGVGQRCPLVHSPRASASHAFLLPPARSMASAGRADRAFSISSGTGFDLSHLDVPRRVTVHPLTCRAGEGSVWSQPPSFHLNLPRTRPALGSPSSPESCKGVAGPACSGLGRVPPRLCPPHTSPLHQGLFCWQKAISVITRHITTAISNLPCTFPSMMPLIPPCGELPRRGDNTS